MNRFLVIGAFDASDPEDDLFLHMMQGEYFGMLIEPNKQMYQRLVAKFGKDPRIVIYNTAVCETSEPVEFVTVDESNQEMINLLGSSGISGKIRNNMPKIVPEDQKVRYFVNPMTIRDIGERFGYDFDYIQVDTEGMDYMILRQILYSNMTFRRIRLESMWMTPEEKQDSRAKLEKLGYIVHEDGNNMMGALPNV